MPIPKPRKEETRKKFMSRCMGALSGEFEREDQRAAVCNTQWCKRRSEVAKAFRVVAGVLHKQDIPEVEAVIRLLTPALDKHWQDVTWEAIRELTDALEDIPDTLGAPDVDPLVRSKDRDKTLEDLVLALLLSLESRLVAPPVVTRRRMLVEGAKRLLAQGSRVSGLDLDLGDARVVTYPSLAAEDALLGVRGRFLRRRGRAKALIEAYLTNRAVRRPEGFEGEGDYGDTFDETLGRLLGREEASSVPLTMDAWAYRWFNVGTFAGAVQGGQTAVVAQNNPPNGPDAKTTPFCGWVHGKVVGLGKIKRQLDDYTEAIRQGDPEAQIQSWPFLSNEAAKDPASFRGFFAAAGLPPYHGRCRTVVFPQVIRP